MSTVITVPRSETSQRMAIAAWFRERPNIDRRTGGPSSLSAACKGAPHRRPVGGHPQQRRATWAGGIPNW